MKRFVKRITSKKRGFTLVELIVVIAILGVLAAILVPTLLGVVRDARVSTQQANARQVFAAAKAAYVSLSISKPSEVTPRTYDSEDDGDFITRIKEDLGPNFNAPFAVTISDEGVTSVNYNGTVYDGNTFATADVPAVTTATS